MQFAVVHTIPSKDTVWVTKVKVSQDFLMRALNFELLCPCNPLSALCFSGSWLGTGNFLAFIASLLHIKWRRNVLWLVERSCLGNIKVNERRPLIKERPIFCTVLGNPHTSNSLCFFATAQMFLEAITLPYAIVPNNLALPCRECWALFITSFSYWKALRHLFTARKTIASRIWTPWDRIFPTVENYARIIKDWEPNPKISPPLGSGTIKRQGNIFHWLRNARIHIEKVLQVQPLKGSLS